MSLDTYPNVPSKHETELFKSQTKIRAADGSDIDSQVEGDITFRISLKNHIPFLGLKIINTTCHIRLQF